MLQREAEQFEHLYWNYVGDFLESRRTVDEMDAQECAAWVQAWPLLHLLGVSPDTLAIGSLLCEAVFFPFRGLSRVSFLFSSCFFT